MADDIKGDLYYIDPHGNQWKIIRKPAERHPGDWYWHADLINRSDNKAHRVSVNIPRLLTGIDTTNWESKHDGATQNSREESSGEESNNKEIGSTEKHRQAYFG